MSSTVSEADIVVVGAGAAGCTAAIFAADARPDARVVVLDGARRVGAKILAAGGGRCNVTHRTARSEDYHGDPAFVRTVLRAFGVRQTRQWMATLGVQLKEEPTGKLFPVTDSSQTVLQALLDRMRALNVQLVTRFRVRSIAALPHGFSLQGETSAVRGKRLVVATGGCALPKSGSDGGAFAMLQALGHTVTETHPALVPLRLADDFVHRRLSGTTVQAALCTFVNGKRVDHRSGSLLFTHFGVSGPVVLDASRHVVVNRARGHSVTLRCSLFPGRSFEEIEHALIEAASQSPRQAVATWLQRHIPRAVAGALCSHVQLEPSRRHAELGRRERRALCHALTDLPLPVTGDRGWHHAEVTAGGVSLAEVDPTTMASRLVPNLYLAGELLDCDGRIGGFNLQWAWASGFVAGRAAAERDQDSGSMRCGVDG